MTAKHDMPVVILCGGKGTRLREETEYRPKPMVEIGPQPILWHIMKSYGAHGLDRFLLCLGYKGWEIKQYFLRYKEMHCDFTVAMDGSRPPEIHNQDGFESWRVTCAETGAETATGARLWKVRKYLDVETFCFTYGDAVSDVDVDALLDFHWAQGRIATVTGVHPTSRYGEIRIDGPKAVEFDEKPTAEGVVSGGFFVFQREVFNYLDDDPNLFLEQKPLRNLARDGQLSVYLHEGFWHPMDTYRDYLHLNDLWKRGETPWKKW
ncbi:MAG: glucose-1-phosphate cytidylyltransferase [Thermoanaerobaculia bacterium]